MAWKDKVHPELARRVETLLHNLAALGLDVRVVQSLRTFAEQDELFKKRPKVTNARGGQSNHNYGLAVDLCPFVNGQPDWNNLAPFNTIGREAKKLGLEWGGDWKFKDMPHVQLRGLSIKECFQLFNRGGLPAVWTRMYEILGGAKPATFTPAADDLIEFGDKGAEVKKLQEQLQKLNLLQQHEVDGDFGKITKNAVISFQRQNQLTADGIVGQGTKAKLEAAIETNKKIFAGLSNSETELAAVPSTADPTQNEMLEPATSTETNQPVSVEMNSSQSPIDITSVEQKTVEMKETPSGTTETTTTAEASKPETVIAPASDGSTSTSVKATVLGIAVPPTIAIVVKAISDIIEKGFISAGQIGDFVMNLVTQNLSYVFILIGLIIVGLMLRKAYKQISFFLQMWFAASKDKNNVEVKPQ